MPAKHVAYYEEYEGQFEHLAPNLKSARKSLSVTYMDIDSIEDLEPAL